MNSDPDGCLSNGWKIAITAGILVVSAAVIVATGGLAAGGIACTAVSIAHGAAIGAATSAISYRASNGTWKGAGCAALSGAKQGAIDGAFSGAVTGALTGAASGALKPRYCFVAGTPVVAAAGYVAIETLKPGDLVWAWDEETCDVALKPVKQLFINESDELIHLTVNGKEITTTPSHPFYVAHKGWYAAVDLRAGDILVLVNGEYVTLEKTQHEILEAPITVYNFEVEDYHTYYVGTDGVLVHNRCDFKKYDPEEIDNYLGKPGGTFHREVKPKILSYAKEALSKHQNSKLGKNPDILLRKKDGAIKLSSRINKGVSYLLDKTIRDFLS